MIRLEDMNDTKMKDFGQLAAEESVAKTAQALQANNIQVVIAESGQEAKEKVLQLIPAGAEVMCMSSVTLDTIGLSELDTVKKQLMAMDRATQSREMRKLGSAPDWAIGSVQAVTEDGQMVMASNSGSQLPAYAYGSEHVIWVVGQQKIVKNLDEAFKRIYEYVLPLEDARAQKAYGMGSNVSKILIINKEIAPQRITVILVKESLGF